MKALPLFFSGLIFTASCSGPPPSVDVKIWQGWPPEKAIVRLQANEILLCEKELFRDYVCMTGDDLEKMVITYTSCCNEWKSSCPKMSEQEIARWGKVKNEFEERKNR